MALLSRWLREPQGVWLRRVVFQLHLWTGIAIGLYLVLISVTGSAVVFRREVARAATAPTVVAITGPLLTEDQLRQHAQRAYPDAPVTRVYFYKRLDVAAVVSFKRPGEELEMERRFNPYTGEDVGPGLPLQHYVMEWLVDLHDNLLAGDTGRKINAVGGGLLTLLSLSGLILWWPGTTLWIKRLGVRPRSNWRLFNWELHGALGMWSLALLLLWAITGVYFGFPWLADFPLDYFDPDPEDFERPGDAFVAQLVRWHFGRFGGLGVRILWVVLGLIPAVLFVTGGIMWWNRVLRRAGSARPVTHSDVAAPATFPEVDSAYSRRSTQSGAS